VSSLWEWPTIVNWSTWSAQYNAESGVAGASLATRSTMGASLGGDYKWHGGVLGPDGKIYGIPEDASDILIIDPVAGTAVLGPDGKIYGMPYNASDILIIDPVAGTATRSDMGASLSGSYKWYGGVLGPDGKIYGMPYSASDILTIDPNSAILSNRLILDQRVNKL